MALSMLLIFKVHSQNCVTPPLDLVGWWSGDNHSLDISGYGDNASTVNVSYGSAKVDAGFIFNGTNSIVLVPKTTNLAVQSFTIDAWIYAKSDTLRPIVEYANTNTQAGVHLWIGAGWTGGVPGSLWANLRDSSYGNHVLTTSSNAVSMNQWHFVAVSYDHSTGYGSLYLDGTLVDQQLLGVFTPKTDTPLYIGHRPYDGGAFYFNGTIDEVEVFDRALSQSELNIIYNAGSAGKCKPCVTPPSGMAAWWSADNHSQDISGNANNATTSGVTYSAGKVESGFLFNGTNSSVIAPNSTSLTITNLTFDAWIYPTETTWRPIVEYGDDNQAAGAHFWVGAAPGFSSTGSLFANIIDTAGTFHVIQVDGVIPTNQWSFVAVTYDKNSGVGRLHLNGVQIAQQTWGSFVPETRKHVNIGYRPTTSLSGVPGSRFLGIVDEVEIFNRALSTNELQSIYNASSAGKCKPCVTPPSGMAAWWSADNHSQDISGHANNATASGITYTIGKVESGFQFNGTSSSVIAPNSASLTITNLTFDAWIYPTETTWRPIVEYADDNQAAGAHFWVGAAPGFPSTGSLFANIRDTGGSDHVIQVDGVIATNQWSFVAVTYDKNSGVGRLHLNGSQIGQQTWGSFVPETRKHVNIGYRPTTSLSGVPGSRFLGIVDEVEIFNRALSTNELQSIYNAGSAGKCK